MVKKAYKANIDKIRLKLAKLQESKKKALKLKATVELAQGWKTINKVLHYKKLLFIFEIIETKHINQHDNNL